MSIPLNDFDAWPEGIAAARIPANNNVRRLEALSGSAISASTTGQPVSPDERDIYIIPAGATGTNWATFDEGDVAIFYEATWTAYAPFDGLRKFVEDEGEDWQYIGDSSGGWAAAGGGVPGGAVAGSDKQVQYNDAGAFGAEAGFEYDKVTNTLTVPNATLAGLLNLAKGSNIASAGTTDIAAATANFVHITGTTTITALGTAQAGAQRIVVFDGILTLTHNGTSLILPTAANITTAAGDTAFMVSEGSGNWRCVAYFRKDGTPVAAGGGSVAWGAITGTLASQTDLQAALDAKGAAGIPQNSQSTAYTLVLGDANKHILHPSADTTARTMTIPANSSVAFPIGTAVTFVNQNAAGVMTIAITTDTMRLAGAGTTGSRTLAANGVATALKITSTEWIISGTGLT